MARRQRRELVLLAGCFGMVIFFALNYDVYDVQVFLLIPLMVLGLLAAVGLDAMLRLLDTRRVPAAATLVALLLPYGQYSANVRVNDQRRHTYEMRFFDALFDVLPERTAIIGENYPINHMVLYKLIGERAGRGRRIELIRNDPETIRRYMADGFTVYAFVEARTSLEFQGVEFKNPNLPLPNPAPIRHIYDTEAYVLAYGVSVVTSANGQPPSDDGTSTLEPVTGTSLRLPQ
jgi:hypothetical protein